MLGLTSGRSGNMEGLRVCCDSQQALRAGRLLGLPTKFEDWAFAVSRSKHSKRSVMGLLSLTVVECDAD